MRNATAVRSSWAFRPLPWLCLVAMTGCGGDSQDPSPEPDPLAVTAVSPDDGAGAVESGAPVTATFNRDVAPASVTPQSFGLTAGGTPLSAQVGYDDATRTARLVGPLVPGSVYQAELTTAVTDAEGGALAEAREWSFTTRTWQATAVDQDGSVGRSNSITLDESGQLHVGYYDSTNGDLKYAACAAACTAAANWTVVAIDQPGDVGGYPTLRPDPAGRLHLTYYDVGNGDLRYATCAADCTTAANWTAVAVDQTGDVGRFASLAVDGGGRLHVGYYDFTNGELKYASCGVACTTPANWTSVAVDQTGGAGFSISLAVEDNGRLHAAYLDFTSAELTYATCATACTTAANWSAVGLEVGSSASLAVDGGGRLHVSYFDGINDDLKYATCAASCATAANWTLVPVDQTGDVGQDTSIAVDGAGRLHVSYYDGGNGDLKYATCSAGCTTTASWQSAAVDQAGTVGRFSALALGEDGRVHVVYADESNSDLKYIE